MENRKTENASRPSNRISRLAQPRKYSATPHSLYKNRSSSTENLAQTGPSYNRQANKRSRSATPHVTSETPVRPPIARSLAVSFTPASANKTVNKKPTHEQSIRVLETLRKHFGVDFLPAGLQSMTAKQFFEIMKFFAQKIFGDKMVIQENNVDDVKRFVQLVEYPHQMNKSWFKAPTVSTAYDRNIELMDWLCDFVSFDDDDDDSIAELVENEDMVADVSNVFSNQKCVATFVKDVQKCFVLWNDQRPEYDECKLKLIDSLIAEKTQISDISTRIDRVKSEYETLMNQHSSFGNDGLLQSQRAKSDELKVEVNQVKATVDAKTIEWQETSRELDELATKHNELKNKADELRALIQNQPVSADDREKLVRDLEQKKHATQEKGKLVESIKSTATDNQLKIARLRMQKVSKVFAFNALTHKLFQSNIDFGGISINQLAIHENDTKDRIEEVLKVFATIKPIVDKRRADIQVMLLETQTTLTSVSNDLFHIEDEIGALTKNVHALEVKIRKIENEIVDLKYDSEQQQHQLQNKIDNALERGELIGSQIKNLEKEGEVLKEENDKIFQGIELKADALLQAKRERQARRQAAILELQRVNEELKEVVKHFK